MAKGNLATNSNDTNDLSSTDLLTGGIPLLIPSIFLPLLTSSWRSDVSPSLSAPITPSPNSLLVPGGERGVGVPPHCTCFFKQCSVNYLRTYTFNEIDGFFFSHIRLVAQKWQVFVQMGICGCVFFFYVNHNVSKCYMKMVMNWIQKDCCFADGCVVNVNAFTFTWIKTASSGSMHCFMLSQW